MGVADRICPACKVLIASGQVVAVVPPKARSLMRREHTLGVANKIRRGARVMPRAPRLRFGGWLRLPRLPLWIARAVEAFMKPAAALIPGMGHLLGGMWRMAFLYPMSIAALLAVGMYRTDNIGQGCIGLASAIHSMSILSLLPKSVKKDMISRIAIMAGSMLLLLNIFYWPFAERLNRAAHPEVGRQYRNLYHAPSWPQAYLDVLPLFGIALAACLLFVLAYALSREWPNFRRREKKE